LMEATQPTSFPQHSIWVQILFPHSYLMNALVKERERVVPHLSIVKRRWSNNKIGKKKMSFSMLKAR
jgi:hypothetical protein